MFFDFFAQFDYSIAAFAHSFAEATNGNLYLLMRGLSLSADKGIFFILISVILLAFRKTRKTGAVSLIAMGIGVLITNVILKNVMYRPRPFEDEASVFYQWWVYAGKLVEDKSSFPSGHATGTMAFALSVLLSNDKRFSWAALFIPLAVGFSRIYFCVHFASDVLFGFLVGATGAIVSYFIFKWIYALRLSRSDNAFVRLWFDFSIADLKKKKTEREEDPSE